MKASVAALLAAVTLANPAFAADAPKKGAKAAPAPAPSTAPKLVIDYRGARFGTSLEEFTKLLPDIFCAKPFPELKSDYTATCGYAAPEIGGVHAIALEVKFIDDKFATLSARISEGLFSRLIDALTVKFGPPTETQISELTNRMGAKYQQVTHYWIGTDGSVVVNRYGSTVSESTVYYAADHVLDKAAIDRAKRATEGAKKL